MDNLTALMMLLMVGLQNDVSRNDKPLDKIVASSEVVCSSLKNIPPRGIANLQGMHKNTAKQGEVLVNTLLKSCIKSPSISYLVDETFGYNEKRLLSQITKLSSGGRTPVVLFYITNGASARRIHSGQIGPKGTLVRPPVFATKIMKDTKFQNLYMDHVARLVPAMRIIQASGGKVLIIPQLEDNMVIKTFEKSVQLTQDALPDDVEYRIGRNPCNCTRQTKTDNIIPKGVFKEAHGGYGPSGYKNGTFSNDGDPVSYTRLNKILEKSIKSKNVFFAWFEKYQRGAGSKGSYIHPDKRKYPIPTTQEQKELIRFLRQ